MHSGKADEDVAEPFGKILNHYGIEFMATWNGWQSIPCCFHDESVPSLRIDVQTGAFKCLACGASGGDVYDFVGLMAGVGFVEAKRVVLEVSGMSHHQSASNASPTGSRPGRRGYKPKFRRSA